MQQGVREAVEAIDEDAWQTIADYPEDGRGADRRDDPRRAAADRPPHPTARRAGRAVARLAALRVPHQPHRRHRRSSRPSTATTPSSSSAIADLKDQALAHFPSGQFNANSAWTVIAALAHNLLRWTQLIGLPDTTVRAARTLRRRLLQIPGRLTRTPATGRFTSPPAGPGNTTSPARSQESGRYPQPPERHLATTTIPTRPPPPAAHPCPQPRRTRRQQTADRHSPTPNASTAGLTPDNLTPNTHRPTHPRSGTVDSGLEAQQ